MKKLILFLLIALNTLTTSSFAQAFAPTSKSALQTAVDLWISDNSLALSTYGDINTWDVLLITDMGELFKDKSTFNDDISSWNVSSVTDMSSMFENATVFNQNLSSWDVSSVTNMTDMFNNAHALSDDNKCLIANSFSSQSSAVWPYDWSSSAYCVCYTAGKVLDCAGVCGGSSFSTECEDCVECVDQNDACSGWADGSITGAYECDVNPDWMLFNCPQSCGSCHMLASVVEDECGECGYGVNENGWNVAVNQDLELEYCIWDDYYEEGVDWAYGEYNTFEDCAIQCESYGDYCNGFEFSNDHAYCSFWFGGACDILAGTGLDGYVADNDFSDGDLKTYVFTGICDCDGNILDCAGVCGGVAINCEDDDGDGWAQCMLDCDGIENWESGSTETCQSIVNGYESGCMSDAECDIDGTDPYQYLGLVQMCQACLADYSCEEEEEYNDDEGPPECVMDCPDIGLVTDPLSSCNLIVTYENHGCLSDCEGDDAIEVNNIISMCIECLANDSCGGNNYADGCYPCDGPDGCGNYYTEGGCTDAGCTWYGVDGPGCSNCDPCDGPDGCGNYYTEGGCTDAGCTWHGWTNGQGCGGGYEEDINCLFDCPGILKIFGEGIGDMDETNICYYAAMWNDPGGCLTDCPQELTGPYLQISTICDSCLPIDAYIPGVFSHSCEETVFAGEDWICADQDGYVKEDDYDSQGECNEDCPENGYCTDEIYLCYEPVEYTLCDGTMDDEESDEDWYCCRCNCSERDGRCLASDQECIDSMPTCYTDYHPSISMDMCEDECVGYAEGSYCSINTNDYTCSDWDNVGNCAQDPLDCTWDGSSCYDCLGHPATIPCLSTCDISVFDTSINSSDNANEFCTEIMGLDWSCASECEVGCNPITNLSNVCNNCLDDSSCDNVITMGVEYDNVGQEEYLLPQCLNDCPGSQSVPEAYGHPEAFCEWIIPTYGGECYTETESGYPADCTSDCNDCFIIEDPCTLANCLLTSTCTDDCAPEEILPFEGMEYYCNAPADCVEFFDMDDEHDSGEEGSCYDDCPYFNTEEDPNHSCEVTVAEVEAEEGCYNDCEGSIVDFINTRYEACTECLAIGNCEGVFEDEDDDDDGPPECVLDCEGFGPEPGDDNFCEWVEGIGGNDAECLSDCDASTIEELEELFSDVCGDGGGNNYADGCDPCDGPDGCGNYYTEGGCTDAGCTWYGWTNGPGCSAEYDDKGDDPPQCLLTCGQGFENLNSNSGQEEFCSVLSSADLSICNCSDDDLTEISCFNYMCGGLQYDGLYNDVCHQYDGDKTACENTPDCIWGSYSDCADDCNAEETAELTAMLNECLDCTQSDTCDEISLSADEENLLMPSEFTLHPAFPNPFNPTTDIGFSLDLSRPVSIFIYDITGRRIETILQNEFQNAGSHIFTWNASQYSSGIYFIQLQAGKQIDIQKVTLLK